MALPLEPRFAQLPKSLAERTKLVSLGDNVPAMLAHHDWTSPGPCALWMHGRTVSKELDSGRYLRWIRAGIGAIAVDLPGHGERYVDGAHEPEMTPSVVAQMADEIDGVVDSIRDRFPLFDTSCMAIGGMSAGGMATLRRLCDPHSFLAGMVEGTTGNLSRLYFPQVGDGGSLAVSHDRELVEAIDPSQHLEGWRPVPLLALHNEGDELVPIAGQKAFLDHLREHYKDRDVPPELIQMHTFQETGAPQEHAGFGRRGADAKKLQVEFLTRVLKPVQPGESR